MTSLIKLDDAARALILLAGLITIIYLAVWQADGASRGLVIGAVGAAVGYFYPGKAPEQSKS